MKQPSGRDHDGVVVALTGDIDLGTVDVLRAQLAAVAQGTSGRVVIDLTQVTFCDSQGLEMFDQAHERMRRQQRTLVLTNVPTFVGRTMRMVGLKHLCEAPASRVPRQRQGLDDGS